MLTSYDNYGLYGYYPYSSYGPTYNPYLPVGSSPLYSLLPTSSGPVSLSTGALAAFNQAAQANYTLRQQPVALTNALVTMNGRASDLLQASKQVTAFNQKTAASSTAAVSALAQPGATETTYTVAVSQLAAAQRNAGTALSSTAAAGLSAGTYSLNIQSGAKQYAVSFAVNAGDTNKTVLSNMAKAINGAAAGVTASVVDDALNGTSQLVVQAAATGTANAFTLADTTGSAVAYAGVGTATTAGADAVYTLNGVGRVSSSNNVNVDNGLVSLTLSSVGNATVTVSPDKAALTTAINNFISAYNGLVGYASQNQQYVSPAVAARLAGAYQRQSAELQAIGVTRNPDQTLSIDQTKLSDALKNNYTGVWSALNGVGGLAAAAQSLARDITSSPMTSFANPMAGGNLGYDYFGFYNNLATLNTAASWSMLLPQGRLVNTMW